MNEHEDDDDNLKSIEDLLKEKQELENETSGLHSKLQEGQTLKEKLRAARKDSEKLIRYREKLKNLKSERLGSSHNVQSRFKKTEDDIEREELSTNTSHDVNQLEEQHSVTAPLIREINALKLENSSLVKEKRKVEDQKDALVQELAALNTKHEKLNTICNKLESEIRRLSSFVSKSQSQTSEQKDDIEALKEQLRVYQEEIRNLLAQQQSTQRTNERLTLELNEARAVIRDMRRQPPHVQVYPAPICEPVYGTRDDDHRGYRYSREPVRYAMIRSYSGECLVPVRGEDRRRGAPIKKAFLTPDLTAEIDYEVVDRALSSSKSI